ncbi:MAG: hypothetical protein II779_14485 [Clostridia bacterium]|nr:hypothetical protein [Clostridia bacterium]
MFDIIQQIWQNPGPAYSPLPFWFWNDRLDGEELVRQLDDFHRHGIDGVVIHPRLGMAGVGYLSDEYLALVKRVCAEAKRRFMNILLYDEGMYPSGSAHGEVVKEEPRFAARRLYARPAEEEIPEGEDPQLMLWVRRDGEGKALDVRLDEPREEEDGWAACTLVLGYTGGTIRGLSPDEDDGQPNAPKAADLLNPLAVDCFLRHTHERYYDALSAYFGSTVIGFFTDEPSVAGRGGRLDGGISWSYGMEEDFFEAGGDFPHLAALLFGSADKKLLKDAEHIYREALRNRLGHAYYARLSAWCREHGIVLTGHPAESGDTDPLRYFDIPGQDLVWRMVEPGTELSSPDSVMAKLAADAARHLGRERSAVEVLGVCGERGNPWNLPPDEMMWYLNFLFARGTSMVIPHAFYYSVSTPLQFGERPPDVGPHSVWWKDYRALAGYIKRMSWLGATGTNNPACAVLCSPDYTPVKAVEPLWREGIPFNYLSVRDFMEKAHIHDGEIRIDRYAYKTLLIDGRLRLNAEIVKKIGQFEVEGGYEYRGSDFIGAMRKHYRPSSRFEGETRGDLRFTRYTKSGCEFFLFVNEGREQIRGRLVTDCAGRAYRFDPFTGKTEPLAGSMAEGGFSYPVRVPGWCAAVLGFDPGSLPLLGEEEEEQTVEIIALGEGRMVFPASPAGNRRYILAAEEVRDMAEIKINGQDAGKFLFRPYEIDITALVKEGENEAEAVLTPSPANRYGKPVPSYIGGLTVRVTEKRG